MDKLKGLYDDLARVNDELRQLSIERADAWGHVYHDLTRQIHTKTDERISIEKQIKLAGARKPMTLDDYQTRAKATDLYPPDVRLVALLMGLANEAGEALGHYKKYLRGDLAYQDENALKTALIAEIGDVLWYVAMTCDALGVPLSDVAQGNLDKLASRYERGVIKDSGDNR